ncbi:MAG TPA: hypothetical protein VFP34_00025 [Microlunatus sp.]|nr:hypothetical protein [Microlunatus sp.]
MPAAYAAPSAVVSATPQLVRIVLDPSRLRKGPPALLLALRDDTTVVIDDDRPAAARALVDGRDETTRTAPCEPRHSPGRADQEANAKRLIAEAAVSLLTPTSSIAVDSGTTCYAVASALPRNFRGSVLTRSVPVLQQMLLHPEAIVLGLGGELLAESQVLIGPRTTAAALEISVDVFFLGANSVDVNGVYLRGDRE